MANVQSCHADSMVILFQAWLVLALALAMALDLGLERCVCWASRFGEWDADAFTRRWFVGLMRVMYCAVSCLRRSEAAFVMSSVG